jgi:cortical protein marker for cell polarity
MHAPGDSRKFCPVGFSYLLASLCFAASFSFPASASSIFAPTNQSIPWAQLGASATAQYSGDGLGVIATPLGAQLRCVLQKLEGEVTVGGLSLSSTVLNARDQLHVTASRIGREGGQNLVLEKRGTVHVVEAYARYVRPALIEEYSVTADGIRQDFLVTESPAGRGPLRLHLTLRGARAESSPDGAQLVLNESGRKLNYNRLRVTDATGRELAAWMEPAGKSKIGNPESKMELAVVVEDAGALYPLRIDPTFSDANWISMGGMNGTDGRVLAMATDGASNLYIGGLFTTVSDVAANCVARWDGTSWSALAEGLEGDSSTMVEALAVSGGDVYVGGRFQKAGVVNATNIAKWNGSSWSALGLGLNSSVRSLAVSGSNLYAGGFFTAAGNVTALRVAQWNGSAWFALGQGISGGSQPNVYALAILNNDLYVGGYFTSAGVAGATNIARWDGTSWSPVGLGMRIDAGANIVYALAVSGSELYAGGAFTTAGGITANGIAKWDGASWSALVSGVNGSVRAIAISGSDLYAGGSFTTANGVAANRIAKWNGSSWSALGSGVHSNVQALAAFGGQVYAGGLFASAGGNAANYIAKWNGGSWSPITSPELGMGSPVSALWRSWAATFMRLGFLPWPTESPPRVLPSGMESPGRASALDLQEGQRRQTPMRLPWQCSTTTSMLAAHLLVLVGRYPLTFPKYASVVPPSPSQHPRLQPPSNSLVSSVTRITFNALTALLRR